MLPAARRAKAMVEAGAMVEAWAMVGSWVMVGLLAMTEAQAMQRSFLAWIPGTVAPFASMNAVVGSALPLGPIPGRPASRSSKRPWQNRLSLSS